MLAALGKREDEIGGGALPREACSLARRRAGRIVLLSVVIGLALAAAFVVLPASISAAVAR